VDNLAKGFEPLSFGLAASEHDDRRFGSRAAHPLIRLCQRDSGSAGEIVPFGFGLWGDKRQAALEPLDRAGQGDRERQRWKQDGQGSSSRTGEGGQRSRLRRAAAATQTADFAASLSASLANFRQQAGRS